MVGLSLCCHPPMILMTLPVIAGLVYRDRGLPDPARLAKGAACACLASMPWLLLPIRSAGGASVAWSDASTVADFWRHATRSGYPLDRSVDQLANYGPQLRAALVDLWQSMGPACLALVGVGILLSGRRAGRALAGWAYLATPLALCFLMEGDAQRWELMANRVFFLPGLLGVCLACGDGATHLLSLSRRCRRGGTVSSPLSVPQGASSSAPARAATG